MSRRPPSDNFTRFTSTSPHASSKPGAASTFSYQPPIPRNKTLLNYTSSENKSSDETPKEKVARLRAAARAAKSQQSLSVVDRMIDRGRIWADTSHRVVTYGLIGFTGSLPAAFCLQSHSYRTITDKTPGVATIISLFGLGSLITHNRRQKRAWIEREMQRLIDAQTAFLRGEASPEQLHLLEQEQAGEEMTKKAVEEKRRKKEAGMWGRLKGVVGITSGDMGREMELPENSIRGGERLLDDSAVDDGSSTAGRVGNGGVMQALLDSKRVGEQEFVARTGIRGGPLDVLADNVASAVIPKSDSDWMSWISGSGKT